MSTGRYSEPSFHDKPTPQSEQLVAELTALRASLAAVEADLAVSGNSFRVVKRVLMKQWFLSGMLLAVILAAIYPEAGRNQAPLYPQYSVKYIAVGLIFLLSGLSLKTRELGKSALYWKYNLYFFVWVFVFSPIAWFALRYLLDLSDWFSNEDLLDGLVVMGVLPSTISSQIVLAKAMGGNDAASLFNATFTNLVGVILSPLLLVVLLGNSGSVSASKLLLDLVISILIPIVIGQFLQYAFRERLARASIPYAKISKVVLLIIIFFTFAKTFDKGVDLSWRALFGLVIILVASHLILQLLVFLSSQLPFLGFTRADTAAAIAGAAHKTVAVGITLIQLMYDDDESGPVSIPLLLYHPLQLLITGALVGRVRSWLMAGSTLLPTASSPSSSSSSSSALTTAVSANTCSTSSSASS
ncbi:sodium/bile acid cotransporter 7 [Thecamonas trahens ATCC 50062]|uniref:Sodium/bile acid cotransporter 7 n=1 Tax=Thecamonas trahens ATCC 50062 TaxID=461836 RepID=A0A0L0DGA2_THETB|nr:sodium/bile acid cotransporter 7 [Thecamonas trahens ATCC 50062]KNC51359.1 sodium/bile acid cotransporter 7 [Thecamonas trahens ATCC 50062]|eukprot:XP_013756277.1 sodium/bile acid cotransporter 7 [Thecamonas trahens ATCC 50062]